MNHCASKLVEEGLLVNGDQPDFYVFAEDVSFSSPSAGAAVVNAGNMSGRKMWKTETGETYQQWHEKRFPTIDDVSLAAE